MGPNGEKLIISKDKGQGLIISVFQLQGFGFGHCEMTEEELTRINHARLRKNYVDLDAAKFLCNIKGLNQPIKNESNPFVIEFQ